MFKRLITAVAITALSAGTAFALPEVGKLAPDFHASDINGNAQSLSQYRGKIIVVEWTNPECPFVVKHYKSGNMQKLQAEARTKGVVWLSINSGGEGKQGHLSTEEAKAGIAASKSTASAYILDPKGEIGRMFDAKTTPHMFVVDAEGILAYAGAIDDKPTFDQSDIEGATNYVREAIAALQAGTPVKVSSTRSYGCSVKYGD